MLMDGPDTGESPPVYQEPMAAEQISDGEVGFKGCHEQSADTTIYPLIKAFSNHVCLPLFHRRILTGLKSRCILSPRDIESVNEPLAAEQISTVDISEVTPLSDNLQGRNAPTTPPEERKDTDGWMSLPTDIPMSCPPGLEYLYYTDRLHIYKDMGIWEAIFGIRTKGKYKIRTKDIEQVYYAEEESNWFFRNCCDPSNPFGVKIVDRSNKEVIHLERPLACTFCCSPCCLQKLLVYFPPGHLAGTVEQEVQTSKFSIKDSAGATVLKIKGSDASDCCMSSHTAKLRILNLDGQVVGNIWKHWYNAEDPNSDLNYCGVTFLPTMNVRLKAILLGASFLMDSLYYGI